MPLKAKSLKRSSTRNGSDGDKYKPKVTYNTYTDRDNNVHRDMQIATAAFVNEHQTGKQPDYSGRYASIWVKDVNGKEMLSVSTSVSVEDVAEFLKDNEEALEIVIEKLTEAGLFE